jgi:hypothetical protein
MSPVREEIVLRLTDAQIEAIRLRVKRRKAAIAAAVAVREIGVVELGSISSGGDSELSQACADAAVEKKDG